MEKYNYEYELPEELIANRPAIPRDAARLCIYDTGVEEISWDVFANLGEYLPEGALLVLNDTRVVPARVGLRKETGGMVEVLFLVNEWAGRGPVPVLLDRKVAVGAWLTSGHGRKFKVAGQSEKIFFLLPEFPEQELVGFLEAEGVTPIPKYIKGVNLSEKTLREEYQTVFGEVPASVAAPTASLHFTSELLDTLAEIGVKTAKVTLHVGLGTFAPVTKENISSGRLHREVYSVTEEAAGKIRLQKRAGLPVVAVGTTVARTLEAAAPELRRGQGGVDGATDIFIRPPYSFKIVDAMITNFHLPNTSLMMMVQALLAQKQAEESLVSIYEAAIQKKFRFYSFGDGMLIK